MSWERRKHGRGRYYTRSQRIRGTGKIHREYVGTGEVARLCAWMDDEERAEREGKALERREARRARLGEYAAIFGPLDALDAACSVVMRREMEAAGYHLHKRGEWRKKRANTRKRGPDGDEG